MGKILKSGKIYFTLIFILIVLIAFFSTKYFLDKEDIKRRKQLDASIMVEFGLALQQYSCDFNGHLPPDLAILYDRGYLNYGKSYLGSTDSKISPPTSGKEISEGKCIFVYLGKGKKLIKTNKALPPSTLIPILMTMPYLYGNNDVLVLYSDGNVNFYSSLKEVK